MYASIKDFILLTGITPTVEEEPRVRFLLKYAGLVIRRAYALYGTSVEERDSEDDILARKQVSCWIVKRVLDSDEYANISNTTATAGSFSESFTFANPDGAIFMRKSDYKALGLDKGRVLSVEAL